MRECNFTNRERVGKWGGEGRGGGISRLEGVGAKTVRKYKFLFWSWAAVPQKKRCIKHTLLKKYQQNSKIQKGLTYNG
jgi:hypothetical protein